MLTTHGPEPICAAELDALAHKGVRHGFFTRQGGVSVGLYHGLNVGAGSSDERSAIAENRGRVARWMGLDQQNLVTVHQIHSPDVVIVEAAFDRDRPKSDAMVTNVAGLAIGVLTADCGPVLFADGNAGVIGAAHAGWKGALTGVLENTISAMEQLGARREDIIAVLGPSIGPDNYEVGPEFLDRFVSQSPAHDRYFRPSPGNGHAMFDLPGFTVDRLTAAGVRASATGQCTYADEARFFSYRRTTHRNEPDYGRQISAIALEAR